MRILFLSTWFPYPLNQGCKIRAYYLLKALAQRHDVRLVSFEDAPVEPQWVNQISHLCQGVELVRRDPFKHNRIKTLFGWFSWRPSAVLASYSSEMQERVENISREWKPDRVVALTFVTAPYAIKVRDALRIVDVDNLMTRMMYEAYQHTSTPFRRVRGWLAWQKFLNYERSLYQKFDLCLVVSKKDQTAIQEMIPLPADRFGLAPNGVDFSTHFPGIGQPEPYSLIFNGSLTYSANYHAMAYFLSEIFPVIRASLPGVQLRITGSTSGVSLDRLPLTKEVIFTGLLDDIRPAVASSWVCVVPLREGGGTRVKILEAMALGTPVVSTPKGAEGLDAEPGKHLLIADTPEDFANLTLRILQEPELRQSLAESAYRLVHEKYDWDRIGNDLCTMVENVTPIY